MPYLLVGLNGTQVLCCPWPKFSSDIPVTVNINEEAFSSNEDRVSFICLVRLLERPIRSLNSGKVSLIFDIQQSKLTFEYCSNIQYFSPRILNLKYLVLKITKLFYLLSLASIIWVI